MYVMSLSGQHSELDGVAAFKKITFYYGKHMIKNKCMPGSNNGYAFLNVGLWNRQ